MRFTSRPGCLVRNAAEGPAPKVERKQSEVQRFTMAARLHGMFAEAGQKPSRATGCAAKPFALSGVVAQGKSSHSLKAVGTVHVSTNVLPAFFLAHTCKPTPRRSQSGARGSPRKLPGRLRGKLTKVNGDRAQVELEHLSNESLCLNCA